MKVEIFGLLLRSKEASLIFIIIWHQFQQLFPLITEGICIMPLRKQFGGGYYLSLGQRWMSPGIQTFKLSSHFNSLESPTFHAQLTFDLFMFCLLAPKRKLTLNMLIKLQLKNKKHMLIAVSFRTGFWISNSYLDCSINQLAPNIYGRRPGAQQKSSMGCLQQRKWISLGKVH